MTTSDVRQRSSQHITLSTIVFTALVLALVVELVAVGRSADPARGIVFTLISRAPMLFYLWAIWTIRRAFEALAGGALFGQIVPALLHRVGLALAFGAFVNVFASPILLRWLYGQGFGAMADFDPAAITLGVVGLMLSILARLLARAAAMRTELDEIL